MDLNDSAPLIKFNVAEFSTSFKARILLNKSKKKPDQKTIFFPHIFSSNISSDNVDTQDSNN